MSARPLRIAYRAFRYLKLFFRSLYAVPLLRSVRLPNRNRTQFLSIDINCDELLLALDQQPVLVDPAVSIGFETLKTLFLIDPKHPIQAAAFVRYLQIGEMSCSGRSQWPLKLGNANAFGRNRTFGS